MKFLMASIFLLASISPKESEHVRLVREIDAGFSKEVFQKYGMRVIGTGGEMMGDVQKLFLTFDSNMCLNVKFAREIAVDMVETYLERVNADDALRLHLHQYPFTADNIEFMFIFPEKNHEKNAVVGIMIDQGKVRFTGYDPNTDSFITLHSESFIESKGLVSGS